MVGLTGAHMCLTTVLAAWTTQMRSGRSVVGPDRQLPGKPGARVGLSLGYRVPTRNAASRHGESAWCGPGTMRTCSVGVVADLH